MKYLIYSAVVLTTVLAACGSDRVSKTKEESSKTTDSTADSLDQQIAKNGPLLFPFGFNLDKFKKTGYRSTCGGDCCTASAVYTFGDFEIYTDTSDCGDYGSTERYYLFEDKKLIAKNVRERKYLEGQVGGKSKVRQEASYNFRNNTAFKRADTVRYNTNPEMKAAFQEARFEEQATKMPLAFWTDPRDRFSFTSGEDFTVSRSGEVGVPNPVWFSSTFSPEIDLVLMKGELSFFEVEASSFEHRNIPKDASFAFSTWYAGGGDLVYAKIVHGVLQFWHTMEDEGLTEFLPFEFYLEIDPDLPLVKPDHYIVLEPDGKGKNKLMLAMSRDEQVVYAKYEGQKRQIALRLKAQEIKGRKVITYYDELIHGVKNGTYTHTHDGNYDYVTYKGKNGKEVKFTIDKKSSIAENGAYRKRPLF